MKILLVEDDEVLIAILTKSLAEHHYIVDVVKDGEMGWTYGSTFEYDLVVLDIMLPKLDGIQLCQRFRAEGYITPIILLTSQNASTAKVSGLDAGADDYVVKPFDVPELIARIRALLRRSNASSSPLLVWGGLLLNPSTGEVSYNSQLLTLTNKEYELLELLLRDGQHLLSADEILDRLWSSDEFPSEATVRSHIRRLRHKLVAVGAPSDFIATVHGRGYYLKAPDVAIANQTEINVPNLLNSNNANIQANQQKQYLEFLNQLWISTKPKSLKQLEVLFQVVKNLQSGTLDSQLQAIAHQTAHKLAGTLGTFGIAIAMQLARQLENILSNQVLSNQALLKKSHLEPHLEILEALVISLEQSIQNTDLIQGVPAIASISSSIVDLNPSQIGIKVMIVDDDIDCLRSLPKLLKPWGFKITTLADPQDFWTVLQTVLPDVLVLDINMPQINGFEICQALRSNINWQRLPVLFLSVMTDLNTQNLAFSVGADDYLCKPVAGLDMANRICNRLQRIRAYR